MFFHRSADVWGQTKRHTKASICRHMHAWISVKAGQVGGNERTRYVVQSGLLLLRKCDICGNVHIRSSTGLTRFIFPLTSVIFTLYLGPWCLLHNCTHNCASSIVQGHLCDNPIIHDLLLIVQNYVSVMTQHALERRTVPKVAAATRGTNFMSDIKT